MMRAVIVTTMNDLPGYRIDEVLGEVFGLTVRSRNGFDTSELGTTWTEICAYGTAVRATRV